MGVTRTLHLFCCWQIWHRDTPIAFRHWRDPENLCFFQPWWAMAQVDHRGYDAVSDGNATQWFPGNDGLDTAAIVGDV